MSKVYLISCSILIGSKVYQSSVREAYLPVNISPITSVPGLIAKEQIVKPRVDNRPHRINATRGESSLTIAPAETPVLKDNVQPGQKVKFAKKNCQIHVSLQER